ncbi:MAG: glycerol-3-phosphate 1-O-acyltransferase PlsY [Candidatus Omnitrophica bacterium]|nr:glycerol-3-phosphate 1-O-acyltransferase PlsY [Candidatus Omnitrophota bacterium]
MILLPLLCASYLLGAIPTGLLAGRLFGGVDVREVGSGNVGATNVARVVGKLPGLLVLLVDLGKGWLPVALLASFAASAGPGFPLASAKILLGMAAIAGHIWNPFLGLKGGRGVATSLGVLLGLDPRVALATFLVWLAAAWLTRYVSVASIAGALFAPFIMAFVGSPTLWVLGGIAIGIAVIARHRPNILRLLHGEEHRSAWFRLRWRKPEHRLGSGR